MPNYVDKTFHRADNASFQHRTAAQTKLPIGAADDPNERDADQAADRVVNLWQNGSLKAPEAASTTAPTQPLIQRRAVSPEAGAIQAPPEVTQQIQSARGAGQALPAALQPSLEAAFGMDFSGVRLHTDHRADALNRDLQARAFTTGQDIFFRQGEYRPGTTEGVRLLGHELGHVGQQGGAFKGGNTIIHRQEAPDHSAQHPILEAVEQILNMDEADIPTQIRSLAHCAPPDDNGNFENALWDIFKAIHWRPSYGYTPRFWVQSATNRMQQYDRELRPLLRRTFSRDLGRNLRERIRTTGIMADYSAYVTEAMPHFGLEQNDFNISRQGRYTGLRVLNPETTLIILSSFAQSNTQEQIRENVSAFNASRNGEADIYFMMALGYRESGAWIFRPGTDTIVTAGGDTHLDGRSGLDYFYRVGGRDFEEMGVPIERATRGLISTRRDREPARIEARRLQLAFFVQTRSDTAAFYSQIREIMAELRSRRRDGVALPSDQDLINGMNIHALRTWQALYFAGRGYGQNVLRTILRNNFTSGNLPSNPNSVMNEVLTIDHSSSVSADRLDRARGVALQAAALQVLWENHQNRPMQRQLRLEPSM